MIDTISRTISHNLARILFAGFLMMPNLAWILFAVDDAKCNQKATQIANFPTLYSSKLFGFFWLE